MKGKEMKVSKKAKVFLLGFTFSLFVMCSIAAYTGFDTIRLRGNGTSDPDIELQNGSTISNYVSGTIDFGAANLTTTGTLATSGTSFILSGSSAYLQADQIRLGYTTPTDTLAFGGNEVMKVYNKGVSATDIAANDVVQWDTTAVEIAADTTKGWCKARITNNIIFDCLAWVKVFRPATTNVDTIWVYGKNSAGTAITEKLIGAAGSEPNLYSKNLYSDIDSIRTSKAGNSGDYAFDGIYYNTVIVSAGATNLVFGVANSAIADSGGTGYVVTKGLARATVDANTLNAKLGTLLTGAAAGDAVTIASATADSTKNAKILGRAVQPGFRDNTAILIFVDPK
jgi:hypothetical protein